MEDNENIGKKIKKENDLIIFVNNKSDQTIIAQYLQDYVQYSIHYDDIIKVDIKKINEFENLIQAEGWQKYE